MIKLILYQFAVLYTTIASGQFNTIKDAVASPLFRIGNNITDKSSNEKKKTEFVSLLTDKQVKDLKFFTPLRKIIVNSNYGVRYHSILGRLKLHAGIDLKARYEAVFVIINGIVTFAGNGKKEGNYIIVQHNNLESIYCHLSVLLCRKGDVVEGGNCIGLSGNSGFSTGPHLHFAMKYNGRPVNPEVFLQNIELLNNIYNSK